MVQSATRLVRGAWENRTSGSGTGPDDRTTLTRSELRAAVEEGVREGFAVHRREAADEASDPADSSSGSGSSRGGAKRLVLLVLGVALALYGRRRLSGSGSDASLGRRGLND